MVQYKTFDLKHYIVFVKIKPPTGQITFWLFMFNLSKGLVKKKSHSVEDISPRMTQMSFYLSEPLVAPISGAAAFIRKCTTNIWIKVFPNAYPRHMP